MAIAAFEPTFLTCRGERAVRNSSPCSCFSRRATRAGAIGVIAAALLSAAHPALAQTVVSASALAQTYASAPDIVVVGQRLALGVRPEQIIRADDIATYGSGNVGQLLDEVLRARGQAGAPQEYLVNGRLVSGLAGIDAYPTEAVERIEILPAGAGLRVGASGTRALLNVVLKSRVRTGVGLASMAVVGGFAGRSRNGEVGLTDIRGSRRVNLTVRTRNDDAISEAERGVDQPAGSPLGLGRQRTLRPRSESSEIRLSAANRLSDSLDISANARWTSSDNRALLGADAAGATIGRRTRGEGLQLGVQLDREIGQWLVGVSADFDQNRQRTTTGTAVSIGGLNRTTSLARQLEGEVSATGPIANLPAGPLSLSLRAGATRHSIGGGGDRFVQSTLDVGTSVQIPIASKAAGVLAPLGELSAGVEFNRSAVNRVGALTNATFSLNWQPAQWLEVSGSVTAGRTPPSVDLLADPLLVTPGVRLLDPLSGETVEIDQLTGGNPTLGAQRAASRRLSLRVKPVAALTVSSEYSLNNDRDFVTAFAAADGVLQTAFPERFVRDAAGVLQSVDVRPISFSRRREERLRSAVELEVPVGGESGRLQLNLSHDWLRKGIIQLRADAEPIDLLAPGAPSITGGNQPRHQVEFAAGYASRGLGVRLTGSYRSASFLTLAGGGEAPDRLRFSPLTTLGVRAFVDGSRLFGGLGLLQGSRLTVSLINLTGQRERVRDKAGRTPLTYQPAYRDPAGRTIQLEFRKTF